MLGWLAHDNKAYLLILVFFLYFANNYHAFYSRFSRKWQKGKKIRGEENFNAGPLNHIWGEKLLKEYSYFHISAFPQDIGIQNINSYNTVFPPDLSHCYIGMFKPCPLLEVFLSNAFYIISKLKKSNIGQTCLNC